MAGASPANGPGSRLRAVRLATSYLASHPRANVAVVRRDIREKIEQLKIEDWVW